MARSSINLRELTSYSSGAGEVRGKPAILTKWKSNSHTSLTGRKEQINSR